MDESDRIRLLLEKIGKYKGENTELVSLYVPEDKNLNDLKNHISSEFSEAQNIKSKDTRQNVRSALSSIKSIVSSYKEIPEDGMVIFCGIIDDEMEKFVIENPPMGVPSYIYHCDSTFNISPLMDSISDGNIYGLIVVERKNAQIGWLKGGIIEKSLSMSSNVPGKHNKGGQSADRFDRIIEEKKDNFFEDVAKNAKKEFFDERHNLNGILLGGPSPSRKHFKRKEFLHHELQEKIIAEQNISDTKDNGLKELVEKSQKILSEKKDLKAKESINKLFKNIKKEEKAVYGLEETLEAIKFGAVDTLILSERVDYKINEDGEIDDEGEDALQFLSRKTEEKGGNIELIPAGVEKEDQFYKGFGGIGAILRYDY